MTDGQDSNADADSQGMMLVMFNAIQALALAHPNRATVRKILKRAGKQQVESFESGDADPELIEAYEFYSSKLLGTIPTGNARTDMDLELKF